jgi:dihydrofolate reductase
VGKAKAQISISADGYAAGPNQSEEHPLGENGEDLHSWVVALDVWQRQHGREGGETTASTPIYTEATANTGAVVMGRKMFGPTRGEWTEPLWNGWWGDEPPFHAPVFVLTHHAREPQEMEGGTTFHFVTDGIERAFELAHEAAGEKDVSVAGGAATVQQAIRGGLLDELLVNQVPLLLGGGERLIDNLDPGDAKVEQVEVVGAPGVAHILYRFG